MTGRINRLIGNINKKYPSLNRVLKHIFMFCFSLIPAFTIIYKSTFGFLGSKILSDMAVILTFIFGIFALLIDGRINRKIIPVITICLLLYFFYIFTGYEVLFHFSIIGISTFGVQYKEILKAHVKTSIIILIVVIFASFIGLIPNLIYVNDSGIRDSFGMNYPTDFTSYFFYMLVFFWIAWDTLPHYITILLNTCLFIIAYKYTLSKTCSLCAVIFIAILLLFFLIDHSKKRIYVFDKIKKIVDSLLIFSFPIFSSISFILIWLYARQFDLGISLNRLLTGRLELAAKSIEENGITLFGTAITQIGNGDSTFLRASEYNFVDSSYPLILIRYGIVFFILVNVLWTRMIWIAVKHKNYRLVLGAMLIAIHSLSEHHFVDIQFNILFFIPFTKFINVEDAEKIKVEKERYRKVLFLLILTCFIWQFIFLVNNLRTLVDLTKAYENDVLKILYIVIAIFIIILLYIIIKKIFDKSVSVKKCYIFCMVGVGVICGIVFLSSIFVYKADSKLIENDSNALDLITSSTNGDIYSKKIPSIYKNNYPMIKYSIWYGEDLARYNNTTVITDIDEELYVFFRLGFYYTPISKNTAVYTNDKSVISNLKKAGYNVTDFYSGIKKQDFIYDDGLNLRKGVYEVDVKFEIKEKEESRLTKEAKCNSHNKEKDNIYLCVINEKKDVLKEFPISGNSVNEFGIGEMIIKFNLLEDTIGVRVCIKGEPQYTCRLSEVLVRQIGTVGSDSTA